MDLNSLFDNNARVYEGSSLATRSELDIFSVPPTDVSTLYSSDFIQHFPLHSVKDNFNQVEFVLTTSTSGYMDLRNSFLLVTCKVVQANGAKTLGTQEVAPANLFAHAMWSNAECWINGVLVYDANNNYATAAYIQRLLSKSSIEKNDRLQMEFWHPNIKQDEFTKEKDVGFKKRQELTKESKEFMMLMQPLINIFTQPRFLPAETEIRLVFRRNQPRFCLDSEVADTTGTCPFRYDITRAVFYTARKVVSPFIIDNHRKLLAEGKTMKYPTIETQVKTFTIASGLSSLTTDSIVMGKIPRMIVFGLVGNEAYNGKLAKSPFNFEHHNLSEISVTWNGDTMEHRVIPLSFSADDSTSADDYLVALNTLRNTAEIEALSNGINKSNYSAGKQLYLINLFSHFDYSY